MSHRINSFPIKKGRVNLETPEVLIGACVCVTDGTVAVVWDDDTSDDIDMLAGDSINFRDAKSATISSGKFHDGD